MTTHVLHNLILWAFENREEIKFRYHFDHYENQLKAANVSMVYKEIVHVGFGYAYEQDEALAKAIAECIERLTIHSQGWKSSNGVAAHFTEDAATLNAYREYLERDAFLYYFHWGILPEKISEEFYTLKSLDPALKITMACSTQLGMQLGLGCSDDFQKSMDHAQLEMIVLKASLKVRPVEVLELASFSQLTNPAPLDHLRLSQSLSYKISLKGWPNLGRSYVARDLTCKLGDMSIKLVKPPKIFESSQLVVSRVENNSLLDLYIGMPRKKFEIQQKAVALACEKFGDWIDKPHPFN